MKKTILKILLVGFLLTLPTKTVSFAVEENLPYVEDLGYELDLEDTSNMMMTYKVHDSGWKIFLGGRWRHGVDTSHVWSQFHHTSKIHRTSVRGKAGRIRRSPWVKPGKTAYVRFEKSKIGGNKAYVDVK